MIIISPHPCRQIQHVEIEVFGFEVFIGEGLPEFEEGKSFFVDGCVAHDDEAADLFVFGKEDEFGLGGDIHFLQPVEVGKGCAGRQLVHFSVCVSGSGGGLKFVEGDDGYVGRNFFCDESAGCFGVGEGQADVFADGFEVVDDGCNTKGECDACLPAGGSVGLALDESQHQKGDKKHAPLSDPTIEDQGAEYHKTEDCQQPGLV